MHISCRCSTAARLKLHSSATAHAAGGAAAHLAVLDPIDHAAARLLGRWAAQGEEQGQHGPRCPPCNPRACHLPAPCCAPSPGSKQHGPTNGALQQLATGAAAAQWPRAQQPVVMCAAARSAHAPRLQVYEAGARDVPFIIRLGVAGRGSRQEGVQHGNSSSSMAEQQHGSSSSMAEQQHGSSSSMAEQQHGSSSSMAEQ